MNVTATRSPAITSVFSGNLDYRSLPVAKGNWTLSYQYYPHPNGCSLISEPDDLLTQSQGLIKSMQAQRQAQEHDRVTRKELVCPKYKNDAVIDCNRDQYNSLNNFDSSSVNSNQSSMLRAPAHRHAHKQHNHSSRQLQQLTLQSPANRKQSHAPDPKHQSLLTLSQFHSPPTYEEDTNCYFQPINSPKSNERSGICSLNGSTCFEAIYDQTKNVFAYAKSNQPTLANHSQLDLNRTDLYPQTLLNCNSVEFEGILNHLYSL